MPKEEKIIDIEPYIGGEDLRKLLKNMSVSSLGRLEKIGLPFHWIGGEKGYIWSEVDSWIRSRSEEKKNMKEG